MDVGLHDETLKVGLELVLSSFLTVEQHALSLGENYSRFYTGLLQYAMLGMIIQPPQQHNHRTIPIYIWLIDLLAAFVPTTRAPITSLVCVSLC